MRIIITMQQSSLTFGLVLIKNDRARSERLTVEVRDGKRRRDIRMQSLIAPELTPTRTHAPWHLLRACSRVLFGGAHIPNISYRTFINTKNNYISNEKLKYYDSQKLFNSYIFLEELQNRQ